MDNGIHFTSYGDADRLGCRQVKGQAALTPFPHIAFRLPRLPTLTPGACLLCFRMQFFSTPPLSIPYRLFHAEIRFRAKMSWRAGMRFPSWHLRCLFGSGSDWVDRPGLAFLHARKECTRAIGAEPPSWALRGALPPDGPISTYTVLSPENREGKADGAGFHRAPHGAAWAANVATKEIPRGAGRPPSTSGRPAGRVWMHAERLRMRAF